MFEVFRRNGYRKEKMFEADDMEDIARLSTEKSGMRPEDLFSEDELSELEVMLDE